MGDEQIKPLRVTYDELSAAPYATLLRALQALELEHEPRDEVTTPVAKLADATNQSWLNGIDQILLRLELDALIDIGINICHESLQRRACCQSVRPLALKYSSRLGWCGGC
ncbi:Stf0 family sulfotransferase [Roseovarius arcticus]|uniref:Stf0 family sulfotransferase n=1 Tax=Roseovarius arcticus TaxID=2547404 RepID=UPI001BB14F3E